MTILATIGTRRLTLDGPVEIQAALLLLFRLNLELLQRYPRRWPALYDSGVRWQLESDPRSNGGERWLTVAELYDGREMADCEDLAAARAAELTLDGIPAVPMVIPSGTGWHIVVQLDDGTIEDPSSELGMDRSVDIGRATAAEEASGSEVGARWSRRLRRAIKPLGRAVLGTARMVPVIGQGLDVAEDLGRSIRSRYRDEREELEDGEELEELDAETVEADGIYGRDGRLEYVALDDDDDDDAGWF